MRIRVFAMCFLLAASAGSTVAQMGSTNATVAPGAMMSPAASLDEMLSLFEHEAMGAVKAMPADKYNFAPASTGVAKFDGVRTFAQQVSHLAEANYFFFLTASGMKPDRDVRAIENLKTKDELVQALADSFAFGHRSLSAITTANAFETIKGADGLHTRASVAAFAVAHGFDHYGQIVEYLRMNGIIPPASAK